MVWDRVSGSTHHRTVRVKYAGTLFLLFAKICECHDFVLWDGFALLETLVRRGFFLELKHVPLRVVLGIGRVFVNAASFLTT